MKQLEGDSMSIGSYPKVWNLGHPNVADLFTGSDAMIVAQEKVDGSQFSFGRVGDALHMRSKGAVVYDSTQGGRVGSWNMFDKGITTVEMLSHRLTDGWVYRSEYLQKPKHNALAYDRVPKDHIILFDVEVSPHCFLGNPEDEAARLGLESVPYIEVDHTSAEAILAALDRVSVLGGQKIEGIVFKNYARFGSDGHVLMGKFVSEAFKEVHKGNWKTENPKQGDVVQVLGQGLRTPARWNKAIQHLRDAGKLTNSPKDIGPLLKEIVTDVREEEGEAIGKALATWAMPQITRIVVAGFAEYYKEQLLAKQFEETES